MTELKAKGPRAAHVEGGALPLPLSPAVQGVPPALDPGLLFPPKPTDRPAGAPPDLDAPRPPEKDSGLLDSVLDTLLAPSGRAHVPSPAASDPATTSPWCLFGPELPEDPRGSPTLMNRPDLSKDGECPGPPGQAHKARPLVQEAQHWPRCAPQPPAVLVAVDHDEEDVGDDNDDSEVEEGPPGPMRSIEGRARVLGDPPGGGGGEGGAVATREDPTRCPDAPGRFPRELDFIHVPLLKLPQAVWAARTRQLLEGDGFESRTSPGPFPDCAYPPGTAEPRDRDREDAFALYGDPQPSSLKIKEEEEGSAEAAKRSPRPYVLAGPAAVYAADFALAPPRAPGEVVAAMPGALPAPSGSTLECLLYKAEGAPPAPAPAPAAAPVPIPSPAAAPPGQLPACKSPAGGACLVPTASVAAAGAPTPALYPPLGLNGLPPLGYQAAVLKDALPPPVYPPYLNYIR